MSQHGIQFRERIATLKERRLTQGDTIRLEPAGITVVRAGIMTLALEMPYDRRPEEEIAFRTALTEKLANWSDSSSPATAECASPLPVTPSTVTVKGSSQYYRIDNQIGTGTFGLVSRATGLTTKRLYAVKQPRTLDSQSREMFQAKRKRFSMAEVEILCGNLIAALAYIHSQEIIHQDVKPTNIMVKTRTDQTIVVVLGDFGLSTKAKEVLSIGGTREYWAPEAETKGPKTAVVDIWSLGIVIMEYSFGLPDKPDPFDLRSFSQAVHTHIMQQEFKVKNVKPEPATNLYSILLEMLVLEQQDRPSAEQCLLRWKIQ
ncbi:MAG: hypothetical protein Q9168_001733 [Polycauliona sp. 1 TL-2023]